MRALNFRPLHAGALGDFAAFCFQSLNQVERAEGLYRKALESQPSHANNLVRCASFKKKIGKLNEAEALYLRACKAAPSDATVLGNYANFLKK